jgi:hypothetical protein
LCEKNCKIYIKIDIKKAPCFGEVTPSAASTLLVLVKVPFVKTAILATLIVASTSNALPDVGVTAPKYVGNVLISI